MMRVATWEHAKHDCFMMRVATWEHAKHDCFMMRVTEHRQNVRIFLILMDTFQWALTGYHRHIDFSTDFVLWCSPKWSWPAQYIPGVSFFLFVQLISLYLTGKWIVLVRKFVAKTVLLIFVFWQQRSLCETNGGYPADLCLLTAAVSLWDQWRLSCWSLSFDSSSLFVRPMEAISWSFTAQMDRKLTLFDHADFASTKFITYEDVLV